MQDALGQVSKFEVGHKKETEEAVHARNCLDKHQWEVKDEFQAKEEEFQCPQGAQHGTQYGMQYSQDAQERADLTIQ